MALKEINKRLPAILKFMGDNKFLTGDKPVYQDFYFFEGIQCPNALTDGKFYEENPALKRYHDNIVALPGLKEFLETCEDKDFMFHANHAKAGGNIKGLGY